MFSIVTVLNGEDDFDADSTDWEELAEACGSPVQEVKNGSPSEYYVTSDALNNRGLHPSIHDQIA